ncbi:MAG: molybdate ABC transporter substrate-binding protein [Desulfuromonas sp.]|nr:MAG: molybdate ABC transporter substrate-binding protein [Desulfuromonas sp.]
MKHLTLTTLLLALILNCAPLQAAELLVFAGAGMRVPLVELGQNFTSATGIDVAYDFAGSGRLGGKILMGVTPDLFIPGSEKWAERLTSEGYLAECLPLAYHTPVIITPVGNTRVKSLADLTRSDVKIALGDPGAAAIGRNNLKLFERAGIDPTTINVVARGVTVKQLVQWVEAGSVDAAIVWRADATQSGQVATIEIPAALNPVERIPMCRTKNPAHPEEAAQFWNYLRSEAAAVFATQGFEPIHP